MAPEFVRDPALTVACVLVIVVSVAWIVVSRLIVRELRRAAMRTKRPETELAKSPRDVWGTPP